MASRIGNWALLQSSADPFNQNVNVPAGAEAILVAYGLYDGGAPAFNAQTIAGAALTTETRVTTDAGEQTGFLTRLNPTTGTQALILDHAGAIDEGMHVYYSFWEDIDVSGTPFSSLGSASNGSNNATVSTPTVLTANTGDVAVGIGCIFGTDGITLNNEVDDAAVFNGNDAAIAEINGSGASAQFTITSGDFPAVSGVIIRNATGGGGTGFDVPRNLRALAAVNRSSTF